jgi:hypothetical protein
MLDEADFQFRAILTIQQIREIVGLIPDEWLVTDSPFGSVEEHREAYILFLDSRLKNSQIFVKEAQHARESLI